MNNSVTWPRLQSFIVADDSCWSALVGANARIVHHADGSVLARTGRAHCFRHVADTVAITRIQLFTVILLSRSADVVANAMRRYSAIPGADIVRYHYRASESIQHPTFNST